MSFVRIELLAWISIPGQNDIVGVGAVDDVLVEAGCGDGWGLVI